MTRIEHVAFWTEDLERLREWYERRLGGRAGDLYVNVERGFASYFVEFDGGARLELMSMRGEARGARGHVAFAVGSRQRVDELTEGAARCRHTGVEWPARDRRRLLRGGRRRP